MERLPSAGRPPKLFVPVVPPTTDTLYLSSDSDEEHGLPFHDAPSLPSVGSLNSQCSSTQTPQLPTRFAKLLNYVRDSQTGDTDRSTAHMHQINALINAPIFTAEAYDVFEGALAGTASLTVSDPSSGGTVFSLSSHSSFSHEYYSIAQLFCQKRLLTYRPIGSHTTIRPHRHTPSRR